LKKLLPNHRQNNVENYNNFRSDSEFYLFQYPTNNPYLADDAFSDNYPQNNKKLEADNRINNSQFPQKFNEDGNQFIEFNYRARNENSRFPAYNGEN
jgi:hypothetical protein